MRVLLLGAGGREHAVAHAIARSPHLQRLFVLPGNAGTEALATNLPGDPRDTGLVLEIVRRERIDLTIVGPEEPLTAGVCDTLRAAGQRVFGPSRAAARLEGDKVFAKQLMRQHAVPTAEARAFDNYELARQYIATRDEALVVKAAGLAKGKGVIVCDDPSQALIAAERMLVGRVFGDAGARIVVEERLLGREVSLLAIVAGQTIYVLEPAQDYKRLSDNDRGPNTGGMGAICPAPRVEEPVLREIERQILVPVIDALHREETAYEGILYAGLMLTAGGPKVLEFNCRFGDPETQALLPRLRTDLLEVFDQTVAGKLDQVSLEWDPRAALCVVMASRGYPDSAESGVPIRGLPDGDCGDVFVFHAGTRRADGQVLTAGGRVLGITGLGATLAEARQSAYAVVERIHFDGAQYRRDLGREPAD